MAHSIREAIVYGAESLRLCRKVLVKQISILEKPAKEVVEPVAIGEQRLTRGKSVII